MRMGWCPRAGGGTWLPKGVPVLLAARKRKACGFLHVQ